MIVNRVAGRRGFGAFGGEWETWCDNKFKSDPENLVKCKSQPMGPFTLAPWTDVGAIQRGLPKPSSLLVSMVTGGGGGGDTPPAEEQAAAVDEGLFGVP